MPHPLSKRSDDVTIYLVLKDYGKLGSAYVETDPAEADRETIIRNFLSGDCYNRPRLILTSTFFWPMVSALSDRHVRCD
jgi:hypothetical protein